MQLYRCINAHFVNMFNLDNFRQDRIRTVCNLDEVVQFHLTLEEFLDISVLMLPQPRELCAYLAGNVHFQHMAECKSNVRPSNGLIHLQVKFINFRT
jgi:hypothetical protein